MARATSKAKISGLDREKLRKAVLAAAEAAGKQFGEKGLVSYLEAQAIATPSPFLTLLGKVISDEGAIESPLVTRIEIVAPEMPVSKDNGIINKEEGEVGKNSK